MRGPASVKQRAGQKPQPVNEAIAFPTSIPAPVGGWNTKSSLADMPPLDAIALDNFFPSTSTVDLRPGKVSWATGLAENGKTLLAYNASAGQQFFVSTDLHIYSITSTGPVGAAVSTCTNGRWEYVNMTTSGGSFLMAVNGVDFLKRYDGTTWLNITAVSVPAITGVVTSTLNNICLFKRRLWFTAVNSLTAWYLPVDSIAGAAVAFPMGPVFKRGGSLIAQANWTVDGGTGSDDYLVTATSEGEIAVYQGTDPASSTTWALVGVYYVGKPLSKRCFTKYGGDLLYLSRQGVFLLSKLLLSATIDRTAAVSYKIDGAMQAVIQAYSGNAGWMMNIYPTSNALMVNIPYAENLGSYLYVMNTITKAWCRFTAWDSACIELYQESMYSVVGTEVFLLWSGTSDDGMSISANAQQAYTRFKVPMEKRISLVKPNISIQEQLLLTLSFSADFGAYSDESQITYDAESGDSSWDDDLWDTALWSGVASIGTFQNQWLTVPSNVGFFHSFRLQCLSSTATISWTSTDYALEQGGIL